MANAKQASKRKRGRTALPVLGAAGASLAMASGASASAVPPENLPSGHAAPYPVVVLGEEELSDVSLGTFYVLDQEESQYLGVQLAQRCGRGGGGCRGCAGAGGRCAGVGGRCAGVGARCAGVGRCGARCAVGARCRCRGGCGCGCGVGVVGCAGCGCTCSGCSGPCWAVAAGAWVYVC